MSNPKRSPSIQEGMMNALGTATNVGGRVAGVTVCAPVTPPSLKANPGNEQVGGYFQYLIRIENSNNKTMFRLDFWNLILHS